MSSAFTQKTLVFLFTPPHNSFIIKEIKGAKKMNPMNKLRTKLKEYRLNKNMTQAEVANILGVRDSTITNYEKGHSEPKLEAILELCTLYDVNPTELLSESFGAIENTISTDEKYIIDMYKTLNHRDKHIIKQTLNLMTDSYDHEK